jgi:effector-binding domain-containing protein
VDGLAASPAQSYGTEKIGRMAYEFEVVETTGHPIAVIRRTARFADLGRVIVAALDIVYAFLKTAHVTQDGQNVVVYSDDAFTLEVGVEVSAPFRSDGEVRCSTTPVGAAIRTVHFGPYGDLPKAHEALRAWARERGLPAAWPNWEVYGDWTVDPRELRTDVYCLLAASS